jgi:4-hydroxyphenylpyruvate dioxygenase-like putative hemolysin
LKRVTTIDGIILDYKLFISSEFDADDYIGSRTIAVDGSSIMFIQAKGSMSKEIEIYSKDNGWVSEAKKELLMSSVDDLAIIVEFDDLSSATYYYDHTKTPMRFDPLYEGSEWYSITINLLKG